MVKDPVLEKAKKEKEERDSIRADFKKWAKEKSYKDLVEATEKMRDNLRRNADMSAMPVPTEKGMQARPMTNEERVTNYDRAYGMQMILEYMERQLS